LINKRRGRMFKSLLHWFLSEEKETPTWLLCAAAQGVISIGRKREKFSHIRFPMDNGEKKARCGHHK
jgi:hypothetical protein